MAERYNFSQREKPMAIAHRDNEFPGVQEIVYRYLDPRLADDPILAEIPGDSRVVDFEFGDGSAWRQVFVEDEDGPYTGLSDRQERILGYYIKRYTKEEVPGDWIAQSVAERGVTGVIEYVNLAEVRRIVTHPEGSDPAYTKLYQVYIAGHSSLYVPNCDAWRFAAWS